MESKFIENYKALAPKLKNMSPIERTDAISDTIRSNALIAKQNRESLQNTPKAPNFTYNNPATNDNIAFWKGFSDEGTMRHYDDLMNILDNTTEMKSADEIKNYLGQIKDTTTYKVLPGIQNWVNDFESLYFNLDEKYDLSYPVDLMRYQTTKAKSAFENGYRSNLYTQEYPQIPSPSELLPRIKDSFK